jgi:hypothetical protein
LLTQLTSHRSALRSAPAPPTASLTQRHFPFPAAAAMSVAVDADGKRRKADALTTVRSEG